MDEHAGSQESSSIVTAGGGVKHRRWQYHQKAYLGLLIFVVIAGMPLVAVPALRARLKTRVQTLRAAAYGEAIVSPPARASVGENREPFPKEYARAALPPPYQPKVEAPSRAPFRFVLGGEESATAPARQTPPAKGKPQTGGTAQAAGGDQPPAAGSSGGETQYKKGKSEQNAYDLLLASNPTLAGMVKGNDPALKFQDWGAALMGQESYYVMVSFVQTNDGTVRKYIWNVKPETKEIVALSSYAREISK